MMGPTGIGVLWAGPSCSRACRPFLGGGGMILDVKLDCFTPAPPPARFEAGTPPIAEAVGLTAAVDYLDDIGMDRIRAHELALTDHALARLDEKLGRTAGLRPCRRRRPGRGDLVRLPRTCTRTTWPRCSTSSASACGPDTTAPSRSCAAWACRRPPGPRSPCSAMSTTSTC